MASKMENPAREARGNPEFVHDQANYPEYASPLATIQALRLTRRCAVTATMAAILAPLVFGEVPR